jgi:hypothetical protein
MMQDVRYDMSIILATDSVSRIRFVLDAIRSSMPQCRLEIVIVCDEDITDSLGEAVTVVYVASVYPLAAARAAGIIAASAPRVFIGETHSVPRAGMFDGLIAAHNEGALQAVPAFENENPGTLVSWACFINGYAPWSAGRPAGPIGLAPLFNASYERDFLVGLGDALARVLMSGEDLMTRIKAVNGRATFAPRAVIGHVNISRLRSWLVQRIIAGRVIASVRSASWSVPRRMLHAIAFPLIPVVLIHRYRSSIVRTVRSNGVSWALWPLLFSGMICQAYGEALGYALGRDEESERRYDRFEIEQMDYA